MSRRRKNLWTDARLARLQRMLDAGLTPEQCARSMERKTSTIKTVISKHDLRYTHKPKPSERLPVFSGWSFDDEEPGDRVGPRYSPRSMAESMPRRGSD